MKIVHCILLCVLVLMTTACDPIDKLKNSNSTMLVDLDAVAQALGRDELMKQEILTAEQKIRGQLEQVASELQNQVKQAQDKLGSKSKREDKAHVEQLALKAQQTFRQQQAVAQQKVNQARAELMQKFRDEIKLVAEPVARKQGASMVKIISADVLWFDPVVHITGDVIAQMRAVNN